jgi:hypothetical protein
MLIAQGLNPIILPQSPGLTANLASVEGFLFGGFTLANGLICVIHVDAQAAELCLHLQDFKLASAFLLECGDQRFQIPA